MTGQLDLVKTHRSVAKLNSILEGESEFRLSPVGMWLNEKHWDLCALTRRIVIEVELHAKLCLLKQDVM
jgi:hypothetical protein